MTPSIHSHDAVNGAYIDAKFSGKIICIPMTSPTVSSLKPLIDFFSFGFRQLSTSVFFSKRIASLFLSVMKIISSVSDPKMIWSDAFPHVAFVKDALTFWWRSIMNDPTNYVSANVSSTMRTLRKLSITFGFRGEPNPASFSFQNIAPESFDECRGASLLFEPIRNIVCLCDVVHKISSCQLRAVTGRAGALVYNVPALGGFAN